jgi:hypothetical protein
MEIMAEKYISAFVSYQEVLDREFPIRRKLLNQGFLVLYSDMAWSRSSDIYIEVIYLHMVFVFYFISPETVSFRCHFVLYMIYLSLCM